MHHATRELRAALADQNSAQMSVRDEEAELAANEERMAAAVAALKQQGAKGDERDKEPAQRKLPSMRRSSCVGSQSSAGAAPPEDFSGPQLGALWGVR